MNALPDCKLRNDALVDKAYGRSFSSDADRVAHLFSLYAEKVEKWKGGKVERCEREGAPKLR